MIVWVGILSFIVILQWAKIYSLQDEIERIKSWYPFVELCKMRIPKNFYRDDIKIKTKFTIKEDNKDDGETNRT